MRSVVGRLHHCAKGQRLMAISHPSPASGAVTLSRRLSRALLTSKLPLQINPPTKSSAHTLSISIWGGRGSTRRKDGCWGKGGGGAAGASGPGLRPRKSALAMAAPSRYVSLPLHGTRVRASAQAGGRAQRGWQGRGGGSHRRRESSVPPSVFTVFKVLRAHSARLSGG